MAVVTAGHLSAATGQAEPTAPAPWPIDSAEGSRLATSMTLEGQRALARWRPGRGAGGAWEAQHRGHYCAPASAVAALRFLRVAGPGLTQDAVYNEIVVPHGLFTAGVSFEHGKRLMEILGGDILEVQAWQSRSHSELGSWLQEDLTAAFVAGEQLCILANYWRPIVGGGHWSPLGGFADGKVLILDTNATKNSPQWMPLDWLVEGLCRHNDVTGLPRGYLVVKSRRKGASKDDS